MKRVSTVELIRNFGAHSDTALATPIIVTKNGRDRLVLISIEQYDMLQHAYDAFEDARPKAPQERAKPPRVNATGRRKS
ncbi:MAG: type II toxin-antitoxin system prevent-host-death family antitoxin [Xanthobacteraceae bacterium]|jgi:PHD/YefM family antitoxin component YafN of YafNO toxin-antitoxin module